MEYLYIKDKTWSLLGFSAKDGSPGQESASKALSKRSKSPMIVEGLGNCFYPVIDRLEAPAASATRCVWQEGARLGFGFIELISGTCDKHAASPHEMVLYVLNGTAHATVGRQQRKVKAGDVIEIPRGARYELAVPKGKSARLVGTRSTSFLEAQLQPGKRATH